MRRSCLYPISMLLAAFSRALSHQMRTPLSVISNDLFYLQTLVAPEECQRSLERCKSISDILARSCELDTEPLQLASIPVSAVLPDNFCVAVSVSCRIRGDRERLRRAFCMLSDLLCLGTDGRSSTSLAQKERIIVLTIETCLEGLELEPKIEALKANCFTQLFNIQGRQDGFAPMFIDAILWEHGAHMDIESWPAGTGVTLRASIELDLAYE